MNCHRCNSSNCVWTREIIGKPGEWNYSWIEYFACQDCGKKLLPMPLPKGRVAEGKE